MNGPLGNTPYTPVFSRLVDPSPCDGAQPDVLRLDSGTVHPDRPATGESSHFERVNDLLLNTRSAGEPNLNTVRTPSAIELLRTFRELGGIFGTT